MEVKIIMIIVVIILLIIEIIIIVIIVMFMRIKIEENGMGRRGVSFKWRSSQKCCKVDGFKTLKLKLHPNHKFTPGY